MSLYKVNGLLVDSIQHNVFYFPTGEFEVNVLILTEAPQGYMARPVNYDWVILLKEKILTQPRIITTILPVLVDPEQVCIGIFSY